MERKEILQGKKRIVIKIGTSTIIDEQTGEIDEKKLDKFVRILVNLREDDKEIVVVSSGAVGVGKCALGLLGESTDKVCAAVGQGRLMTMYEKLFMNYDQLTAQVLLTKESIANEKCRTEVKKTFQNLMQMGVIAIVNENDAVSVDEKAYGNFGDNDTMAAHVAAMIEADLLILMSDIEGLYTDDPKANPKATFISTVRSISQEMERMAKGAGSSVGTGGMATKIQAAKVVTKAGADMVIANGANIGAIRDIMEGKKIGTLFLSANR